MKKNGIFKSERMIYREPSFLISYNWAFPGSTPPPPFPAPLALPPSLFDRRHTGRLRKRDNLLTAGWRCWGRSQIIGRAESLVLDKSFNTLWLDQEKALHAAVVEGKAQAWRWRARRRLGYRGQGAGLAVEGKVQACGRGQGAGLAVEGKAKAWRYRTRHRLGGRGHRVIIGVEKK